MCNNLSAFSEMLEMPSGPGMVVAFKLQLKSVVPLVLDAWFSMYLSWCSHLIPTPLFYRDINGPQPGLGWVASLPQNSQHLPTF